MRDDEVPCTVEKIEIFATHEYFCVEDTWRDEYTPETGEIITNLIAALEDLAELNDYTYDWNSYVNSRDYMVTETNCTWDRWPDYLPESSTHCERITGQVEGYGSGSISVIMDFSTSPTSLGSSCGRSPPAVKKLNSSETMDL
jgi:hypothetical protein